MCRSRRELSNAYLLAKFGFDTAENEPSKVWQRKACSIDREPRQAINKENALLEAEIQLMQTKLKEVAAASLISIS